MAIFIIFAVLLGISAWTASQPFQEFGGGRPGSFGMPNQFDVSVSGSESGSSEECEEQQGDYGAFGNDYGSYPFGGNGPSESGSSEQENGYGAQGGRGGFRPSGGFESADVDMDFEESYEKRRKRQFSESSGDQDSSSCEENGPPAAGFDPGFGPGPQQQAFGSNNGPFGGGGADIDVDIDETSEYRRRKRGGYGGGGGGMGPMMMGSPSNLGSSYGSNSPYGSGYESNMPGGQGYGNGQSSSLYGMPQGYSQQMQQFDPSQMQQQNPYLQQQNPYQQQPQQNPYQQQSQNPYQMYPQQQQQQPSYGTYGTLY